MFERDRRVTFTRRYHSVLIQDPDQWLLPRTQAEWDSYDMACLGDLDGKRTASGAAGFCGELRGAARRVLVCLAGPRGLPRAFSLGALAGVLPVRVSSVSGRDPDPVTVVLTAAGQDHPVMQILNDSGLNQKLWPLFPPLQWIADPVVAKPGATVLLAAQNAASDTGRRCATVRRWAGSSGWARRNRGAGGIGWVTACTRLCGSR